MEPIDPEISEADYWGLHQQLVPQFPSFCSGVAGTLSI